MVVWCALVWRVGRPTSVVYFYSPAMLWPQRPNSAWRAAGQGWGVAVAGYWTDLRIRVKRHVDQFLDRGDLFFWRCCVAWWPS